jgi:hypothetical protein
VLAQLAQDPATGIRKLVVQHHQAPLPTVAHLAGDPDPSIRHLARRRLPEEYQDLARITQ